MSTAQAIVVALGVFLGLWHLWLAANALFVFREGEPLTSWVAVLAGPGATFGLVVISIAYLRVAAAALLCLSMIGLIALLIQHGRDGDVVIWYFVRITLPMAALGVALFAASRTDSIEAAA